MLKCSGLVAQLVRALPRHGRGQKFESSRAHEILQEKIRLLFMERF